MKRTLLASLAAVTLCTPALLAAAPAQASSTVEIDHEVTAAMGPEQDYQRGLTVNDVAPTLRSVTVGEETILAYCIEYWVRAAEPDHQAAITSWDGFTGDNNFKTDPQVREAVAWILHNSYPALSVDELAGRTEAIALTEAEAIAATQAAIWFYTDDFVSDGVLTVEATPGNAESLTAASANNVQNVFDYLIGEDNTGLTEQEVQASVTLHDLSDPEASVPEPVLEAKTAEDDHLLGPVSIRSSSEHVTLELEATNPAMSLEEVTLLDSQGGIIDATEPVGVQELWVHIPADAVSGGVNLAAESTEHGYTGRLIIPEPAPDRRFQTIVVVDQTSNIASTELALHWEKPEVAETPVHEPLEEKMPDEEPLVESVAEEETVPAMQPAIADPAPELQISQPQPAVDLEDIEPIPASIPAAADVIEQEQTTQADQEPTAELAETGAHQTRNILVALATIAAGGILTLVNRLRRKRA